jgi:hypothetical protein
MNILLSSNMNDVLQKMEPHEKVREKDLKGKRQRPTTLCLLIVGSYKFIFLRKIWQNHFFLEYKNVSFFTFIQFVSFLAIDIPSFR